MNEDNIILIGDKPFMKYVTGIVYQFIVKKNSIVILKSRGLYISRCVDVSQIALKKFLTNNIKMTNVKIDSELMLNIDKKEILVSSIEITLEEFKP